jgi:hypothetical protein
MYRLNIVSRGSVLFEEFSESLGKLHLLAERKGYYGQRIKINEVVQSLDGYDEIGLVDTYNLTSRNTNALTGSRKPLRKPSWG